MRAAVLYSLNEPLKVCDLELPKLGVGQVKVRVHCATICGAQIGEQTGAKGPDPFLPHLLGHEGSGIVEDVGPGVVHVSPGDQVVMHWRKGVGIDARGPVYENEGTLIGAGPVATFGELVVVSENRLTRLDRGIRHDVAALFGCAITTALGIVQNEAQLLMGESILVAGCGGVGLNVIQAARLRGAGNIIAVDRIEAKTNLATCFYGANQTSQTIDGHHGPVDVFVDCTGNPEVIEQGMKMVAAGGRTVLVGQPRHNETLTIKDFRQHYRGKLIMDSQGGLANPTVDIPRYVEMYLTGALKVDGMLEHRYPLSLVNEAFDAVKEGQSGRVALEIQG